jgi:hypothetical protein
MILALAWLGLAEERARAADEPVVPPEAPVAIAAPVMPDAAATPAAAAAPRSTLGAGPVGVSGFIQADAVVMRQSSQNEVDPSTGAPLNEDRFLLRRARVRVTYDRPYAGAALELDANTVNGPVARATEANVYGCWPADCANARRSVRATMGLLRTPFGYELGELDWQRHFLERSNVTNAFFPGVFDLGAVVTGAFDFVRAEAGILNGDPLGERTFPGRAPRKTKDLALRLGVDTDVAPGIHLRAGASGITGQGFHQGTPSTKDQFVWRDTNGDGVVQPAELSAIFGMAATPSRTFARYAFGGDARVTAKMPRLGELAVYGELLWGQNIDRGDLPADPIAAGRDLREFGWYAAVTQELTEYAMIGVRYDRYDPDRDANERAALAIVPRDPTVSTVAFTASGRFASAGARLVVEYDRNTNARGRAANGAPATLADDALTVRGEVHF